jgi:4-hydroxythreonine-4-phosphate dehydrogenase
MPSKGEKPAPIVLTMGEPAGIGPEIAALAWLALKARDDICFFMVGDRAYLDQRVSQLRRNVQVVAISEPAEAKDRYRGAIPILDVAFTRPPVTGAPSPETACQVIQFIDRAVSLAMDGDASAVVTNPIQKETLYDAGFRHEGHTDYLAFLARKAGADADPVMMLCAPGLRTIPLTVHIPLSEVPRRLTPDVIVRQAKTACRDLKARFAIASPRLGVTGLNPHAGENGTMGKEEQSIIAPAIASLKSQGIDIEGPFPADTAFHAEARARFDVILCMYHDQALIPVKTLDFHGGVNCTLGLPFVRTSPDHGTGLALAGTGRARPDSLIAAIELAARLARNSLDR